MKVRVMLIIGLLRLVNKLSLFWCRRLGRSFGSVLLKLDKHTNKTILTNLSIAFPNKSTEELYELRNSRLKHMGMTLFEIGHIWFKTPENVCAYCNTLSELHPFVQAAQEEQGIIVLIPHVGNWEILNFYLSQYRTITAMYRPQKAAELDEFIRDARESFGSKLVPANKIGVRELINALKQKGLTILLPDQVPDISGGIHADFFGEPALTMLLANRLAKKTDAKVFLASAIRNNIGFDVTIEPIDDDFYHEDSLISATSLNQQIEKLILAHPEQNQWEYKRYKFCPDYMKQDVYGTRNVNYTPKINSDSV